jgi:hypothetical protein
MRTLVSASLLLLLSASTVQAAAVQLETRAFHSHLRLDHKDSVMTVNGQEVDRLEGGEDFENTAGGGIGLIAHLDPYVSLGVGYDRARYFPSPDVKSDQQVLSLFTRWTLYRGATSRLHFHTGVSQHTLTQKSDALAGNDMDIKYSPVLNYDLGLGQTWTFGLWNVGLAYKYSDTFGRGNSQTVMRTRALVDPFTLTVAEVKTKLRNFNIEQQELALTFGFNI